MKLEEYRKLSGDYQRDRACAILLLIAIAITLLTSDLGEAFFDNFRARKLVTPADGPGYTGVVLKPEIGPCELSYWSRESDAKRIGREAVGFFQFMRSHDTSGLLWPLWSYSGAGFFAHIFSDRQRDEVVVELRDVHAHFLKEALATGNEKMAREFHLPETYALDSNGEPESDRIVIRDASIGGYYHSVYGDRSWRPREGLLLWPVFIAEIVGFVLIARRLPRLQRAHRRYLAYQQCICPRCKYDLRGISSDQCPECGIEIDQEALQDE